MRHRDVLDVIEVMRDDALAAAERAHRLEARRLARAASERQSWAALMAREIIRRARRRQVSA